MSNQENDEVVGFCLDCLTTFPESMIENDKFLQAGQNGICKYCKGPVVVTYPDAVEGLKNRRQGGGIV